MSSKNQHQRDPRPPCPICGTNSSHRVDSKDLNYHQAEGNFSLHECPACEAIFLHPLPDQDELRDYYPTNYHPLNQENSPLKSFFQNKRNSLYGQSGFSPYGFLAPFKDPGIEMLTQLNREDLSKHLDVGCGSGTFLATVNEIFEVDRSVGLDVQPQAVTHTQNRGFETFEGTIDQFDPGETFDLISINHVLEHIPTPHEFLKSVRELLSDDGYLLLSLPNTGGLGLKLFGRYWVGLDIPRHVVSYSEETVQYFLRKHNFEIHQKTTTWLYLDSLKPLLGFKRHSFSLPLSELFTIVFPSLCPGFPGDNQTILARLASRPLNE